MTIQEARKWLVLGSLLACGATFAFMLIAPAIGYPLLWPDALRILELIVPVFAGYLGAAAHYIFRQLSKNTGIVVDDSNSLLGMIVKGPVVFFVVTTSAILLAFGLSNREHAIPGSGMTVDMLAAFVTADLGVLTVTTSAAVSYLFADHDKKAAKTE